MAVRPFGHGPRMCIGKCFAELEIQIGICKLLQNFRIEWAADYDGIEQRLKTLNVPDKKLKFRFEDLKD
jgi:cytochrome P450